MRLPGKREPVDRRIFIKSAFCKKYFRYVLFRCGKIIRRQMVKGTERLYRMTWQELKICPIRNNIKKIRRNE